MRILASDPVLAVHDLNRSAAWYAAVLGAELIEVDPGNWTFCRAGAVTFMLGRCPDVIPAAEIGDHSYVAYLRVEDVDAFHERAVRHGAEVLRPPTDQPWGQRELALRSPDGHRFMLAQPVPGRAADEPPVPAATDEPAGPGQDTPPAATGPR